MLTRSSWSAWAALNVDFTVGRLRYPYLRASEIDALSRVSEFDLHTTRVVPGAAAFSELARLRIDGILPPAHGLIEQSGFGSGQYDGLSTWAEATCGTTRTAERARIRPRKKRRTLFPFRRAP